MAEEYGVLGATGRQGGAVVRALRDRGLAVRALVRRIDDPGSRAMAARGVRVVRADTDDPTSLPAAFAELAGLFAMTVFAGHGTAGEVVQGRAVADAAVAAGVPHVVYSSVGGADRGSGVPHFESKWAVERYLRDRGLRTTVVRPVFFMDNFVTAMAPVREPEALVIRSPLLPDVPLQMIAVRDIGAVVAAVLTDPRLVPSGAVEVAGDELTPEQIAEAFGRRTRTAVRFETVPIATVDDDDSRAMFTWLGRTPAYQADFALTRKLQPAVRTFDTFLAGSAERW
ncbi:NmrA/HSCARG family protein [Streptosporangium sp. G11]|uniref:NmrA/HSCARG family protein n=1 Tax=Streptosporangium sp. G11 TaxID=3436926 RepID=UPI003EB72328